MTLFGVPVERIVNVILRDGKILAADEVRVIPNEPFGPVWVSFICPNGNRAVVAESALAGVIQKGAA